MGKAHEALKEAENIYSETQSRAKAVYQDAKGFLSCPRGQEKAPVASEYAEEFAGEA